MSEDCHECPKPGHFHGKDCWVTTDDKISEPTEPEPCPFCMCPAECVQADNDPDWWIVRCGEPECGVRPEVQDLSRGVAVAQWNIRTPATPPPEPAPLVAVEENADFIDGAWVLRAPPAESPLDLAALREAVESVANTVASDETAIQALIDMGYKDLPDESLVKRLRAALPILRAHLARLERGRRVILGATVLLAEGVEYIHDSPVPTHLLLPLDADRDALP